MTNQFKRILDLVRKTGDTMIVTDQNGQDVYVIMDLDQYEAMISGLSGEFDDLEEDFDWKGEEEYEGDEEWEIPGDFIIDDPEGGLSDEAHERGEGQGARDESVPNDLDIWTTMQSANENGQTWDVSTMSHDEKADLEQQYQNFVGKNVEEAIEDVAKKEGRGTEDEGRGARDKGGDKAKDDDFSEEQFYLEPID